MNTLPRAPCPVPRAYTSKSQGARGKGHPLLILLAVAVFVSLVSAAWDDGTATAQVCFNATGTGTIYAKTAGSLWTVFDVAIPNTGGFFNGNLYANGFGFFHYSDNASDAFVALPALTSDASQRYCIYSGGQDNEGLNGNVAYAYYDTAQDSWTTSSGSVTYGANMVLASSAPTASTSYLSVTSGYTYPNVYMKARINTTFAAGAGSTNYFDTGYSASTTTCTGCLTFYKNNTWKIGGDGNVYKDSGNSLWRIAQIASTASTVNDAVYDDNMSLLGSHSGAVYASRRYLFASAYNGTTNLDWLFAGRVTDTTYNPGVSDIVFDFQNTNITINSPSWGSVWTIQDNAPVSVTFGQGYDQCNATLNGAVIDTWTPSAGETDTSNIDMFNAISGANELNVSCVNGGIESHRYGMFVRTGSSAQSVFITAFGELPSDMGCGASQISELDKCFEGYNVQQGINFSAVVCTNINMSLDYSCLSAGNATKNGYTFFYRPGTYQYPGVNAAALNIEHVGANFVYYGSAFEPDIELISQNYTQNGHGMFVYIPAQTKDRDCDIYYQSNTTGCSWGSGFVLNQGTVVLSDRHNGWYTAGSAGIEPYQINFSQETPPTTVYPIIQHAGDVFASGIYQRLNCFAQNNSFIIRIQNTVAQNYTIYIVGNGTPDVNQTTQSYSYSRDVDLTGVSQVIMYDTTGKAICQYAGGNNLFLPFQMPAVMLPAPFEIITWAMMIFMTVLTSIVPFAAILLILWNDVYHILNISQVSLICILSILFGFVNSSFNAERGIKHMLIILAIATAYLAAISTYASMEGISLVGFDSTINSFNALRGANDIGTFILGIPGFIIKLFMMILLLPVTFVNFVLGMLYLISIPLWTAAQSVAPFITVGFVLYFYLKAYEVLSNRFRPV